MPHQVQRLALVAAIAGTLALAGCKGTQPAEQLMAEAAKYQQQGDQKAALIQLKNAVASHPDHARARFALAKAYVEGHDYPSAEKEARKAISLGVARAEVLPVLARALLGQGGADKVLLETADAGPKDAAVHAARGDAFLEKRENAQADQAYRTALAADAGQLDAMIGLARLAAIGGNMEQANQLTDEAIARHPKDPEPLMFKATLQRAARDSTAALATYDKVLALAPRHRTAYLEKTAIHISARQFAPAKAALEAARKNSPGALQLSYMQGLLDFSEGRHAAARESLQKVLKAAPDHLPTLLLSAPIEIALKSPQMAVQHLRKYVDKAPDNVHARKLLASTLIQQGHGSQALEVLAPLNSAGKADGDVLALTGQAHLQARDFDKASSYFKQASSTAPDSARLQASLAMSLLGKGDTGAAIGALEQSAKLDPDSPQSAMLLASTHMRMKQYDKALAALATQKDNPQVHNLRGAIYMAKGDDKAARASYQKAIEVQPTFYPAVAALAQIAMNDKQPEEAQKQFQALLAKDPKHVQAHAALATLAAARGDKAGATSWLEKGSAANPEDVGAAMQLAANYLASGSKDKALTLLRKFQGTHPDNANLLDLLGQTQLANNDANGALESFTRLATVEPRAGMPHFRMAAAHVALNNEAAAMEDMKKGLELDPNNLKANVVAAELAVRRGDHAQALQIAQRLQKLPGAAPVGYTLEGDAYMTQNKPALAIKPYEQAFAAVKTNTLLVKLSNAQRAAGKVKEADTRIGQWLKDKPQDTMVRMVVAQQAIASKQHKSAIGQLEAILQQDPKNAAALNNLAWAYQQEKDPRAVATAEAALKIAPENPAILDTLGWLLLEQGQAAKALPLLQKAVNAAPSAPELRYHLAVAHTKTGDKQRARKELEHALAQKQPFAQADEARKLLTQM
jgi:putative PEP-CTERM system TPR-repeat lipoprotein